jgi:hypothetical protein
MNVIRKDATISPTGDDGDFPGTFEVVLSAPTLDRDGDTLMSEDWKQPLPDHITFDSDHGMSVATTVGSGVPEIDESTGNLIVRGTYSSLPRAQEVRTLVNEGHIRTTSVAFMTEKTQKDGKPGTVRELLNGAFVAIPSNREALVLASKSLAAKAGARNSKTDAEHLQTAHDHMVAAGAVCAPDAEAKDFTPAEDEGDPVDTGALAQAVDAPLDEALSLLSALDVESLPAEVQQAIALVQAADAAVDELLDALGVADPDEDTPSAAADPAAADEAAAKSAAADEVESLDVQVRALKAFMSAFVAE